eukprot:2316650-Alexandrium_andersonii.AAC.1
MPPSGVSGLAADGLQAPHAAYGLPFSGLSGSQRDHKRYGRPVIRRGSRLSRNSVGYVVIQVACL